MATKTKAQHLATARAAKGRDLSPKWDGSDAWTLINSCATFTRLWLGIVWRVQLKNLNPKLSIG